MLKLLLTILIPSTIIITIFLIFLYQKITSQSKKTTSNDTSSNVTPLGNTNTDNHNTEEQFMCFQGGEDLTTSDILDAPGEVIGKTTYGTTLYKANLPVTHSRQRRQNSESNSNSSLLLLRFLRPACSVTVKEVVTVVNVVGLVRHVNLVPLKAFYVGPRGEKLFVYPFYDDHANLSQFITDGDTKSRNWEAIYNITLGLVKGIAYLHSGLHKPIIHGNLKSKNVLLGPNLQPYISDYGLHMLLNPIAGQEMLENSAAEGYKAPELIKMKDACESTDIYSLGIILLELVTGRKPVTSTSSDTQEMYLPNAIRKAILNHRIKDMYHPDIVLNLVENQRHRIEDRVLKLVQLAMSCCSTSPSLRPLADDVVRKVEELSK